jgi:hypothetical protein
MAKRKRTTRQTTNCSPIRSTWVLPRFLVRFVLLDLTTLVLCVVFCRSLFVLLSFFFWPLCCLSFGHCVVCLLAIVLSGFLRFKDSDYPFGIYKHFLTRVVGRDRVTRTALKTGEELRCSGWENSSCATSGNRRVNLVTDLVISHEWGKDRKVFIQVEHSHSHFL